MMEVQEERQTQAMTKTLQVIMSLAIPTAVLLTTRAKMKGPGRAKDEQAQVKGSEYSEQNDRMHFTLNR